MKRIKIPTNTTNFIINLFENCKLKAIINYGLTKEITAGDGLDQGETISPLLWRILYDPLLSKIQNNKSLGYTMETKWRPDLNSQEIVMLKVRIVTTAFMDNTIWLAFSKENM